MPEIAEIKIMSNFINRVSTNKYYNNIRKSKVSKVKTDLTNFSDIVYESLIYATSRGKELKIVIAFGKSLVCTMGMSGNWAFTKTGSEPKHAHLMFDSIDGYTLSLVDARRFAKWRWGDWNPKRGPDVIKEYIEFKRNILDNLDKKAFKKPICEILLNQTYFNGIGNYLRSEIMYKANQNPFIPADEAIKENEKILKLCKEVSEEAYEIGGGQLMSWDNPNPEYNTIKVKESFNNWLQCYGKKQSIIDATDRRLWFDVQWIKYADIYKKENNQ